MSESNVLILQCDKELKDWELAQLHENILKQKESGVILLPNYVKVVNVPEEEINGELVVMSIGAPEPEPKMYVIKSSGGRYLMSWKKDSDITDILDFTDYKSYAQKFDKESAERIITKTFGKGYIMEEL